MKTPSLLGLSFVFLLAAAPSRAASPLDCKDLALKSMQTFAKFNEDRMPVRGVRIFEGYSRLLAPWVSDDSERKYSATTSIENGKCELVAISMSPYSLFGYRPSTKPEVCAKAVQVALSMHVYLSTGELRAPESFEIRGPKQNTTRDKFLYNWFHDGKKYRVRTMQNGLYSDGACRVQEISYDHMGMHPGSED